MCAKTSLLFNLFTCPSQCIYESMRCVLSQMQLTVVAINTNFSYMLLHEEKKIFCSPLGGHLAEHEREQDGERGGRTRREEGVLRLCESTSTGFSCMK